MFKKSIICLAVLFLLIFVFSGCMPSGLLIRPVSAKMELKETQIQRDKGFAVTDKIAVIDIDGLIINMRRSGIFSDGENPVSLFVEKLDRARNDRNVKAIVLRLNSPGGTVASSDMMYHMLREFKNETNKPVVACMMDVSASGAYYLACGCDGIMAQPSTVTGSIGTIMQTFSFAGTMQKLGIKSEAIKSGDMKDSGSPFRDLKEEERQILQAMIMQFYEQFLDVVQEGRLELEEDKLRELADGRVFTGIEAQQQGLVDKIGYPSDAIDWAKEMAGVEKAKVIIYHRPIGYKPNVYSTAGTNLTNFGALINLELPEWLTSNGTQFLYLWQPGVQ
ncbi:MAG: signal peptide peptidase SppA [Planctomycetota bacterium]|jgi:protease-4